MSDLKIVPPLDVNFQPAIVFLGKYREKVAKSERTERIAIAFERSNGAVSRMDLDISTLDEARNETLLLVDRVIKFLFWSRGGSKMYFSGPTALGEYIRCAYSSGGARAFDVELISSIYERPFEVALVGMADMPELNEHSIPTGGQFDGCRVGFDLGASDYKVAAVQDGKLVFSAELEWSPKGQSDPEYHYRKIREGLDLAIAKLPRLDAIGGSSAGVIVDNMPRVASLFKSVDKNVFAERVTPIFVNLGKEYGVPVKVINDGDVTALAGAMSIKTDGLLGLAMGSSEAAGFIDGQGCIKGWLNELGFAPVDFNRAAALEEWSGDYGVGSMYFSQQSINRLAGKAGMIFPSDMDLPQRLREVQALADSGDAVAEQIFKTTGVYLGYTIPWYAEFYEFEDLLILGRVTSGTGGEIIVDTARSVLSEVFPEMSERIQLHVPDQKSRLVGQAYAAAGLPQLK